MKRQDSNAFNKEKLVFICVSVLLALSLYHLLTSAPVPLVATAPVSPQPPPGPLEAEKVDTRVPDVKYYSLDGELTGMHDVLTKALVNRKRKNPFEPIDEFVAANPGNIDKGPKKAIVEAGPPPPPAPAPPPVAETKKEEPKYDAKDAVAMVDFSGVMTMNNQSYGLLKSKDDKTIQVKVGDYMEDYKYTVTKIEKQAIWVTDDENRTFVARDMSFEDSSKGADDEKAAPKKKEKPAKPAKKDITAAAAPAAPVAQQTPQANQNRNGMGQKGGGGNNQRGNKRGGGQQQYGGGN